MARDHQIPTDGHRGASVALGKTHSFCRHYNTGQKRKNKCKEFHRTPFSHGVIILLPGILSFRIWGMKTRITLFLLFIMGFGVMSEAAPSYCSSPTYGNSLACFEANPNYCSSTTYADHKSCYRSHPSFCSSTSHGNTLACFESKPQYCSSPSQANSLACYRAHPAFCSSPQHKDSLACHQSQPAYCSSPAHANSGACSGTNPDYCNQATNANSPACAPLERESFQKLMMVCAKTKNKKLCDSVNLTGG